LSWSLSAQPGKPPDVVPVNVRFATCLDGLDTVKPDL